MEASAFNPTAEAPPRVKRLARSAASWALNVVPSLSRRLKPLVELWRVPDTVREPVLSVLMELSSCSVVRADGAIELLGVEVAERVALEVEA